MSSNINNTSFYNSLGFMTAADVLLGDNDPDWHAPPVVIKIVRRIHSTECVKSNIRDQMIREVPEQGVPSY